MNAATGQLSIADTIAGETLYAVRSGCADAAKAASSILDKMAAFLPKKD